MLSLRSVTLTVSIPQADKPIAIISEGGIGRLDGTVTGNQSITLLIVRQLDSKRCKSIH